MKVLFIGGTGNISVAVSNLAIKRGIDLYLLNRGNTGITIEGAKTITADIKQPEQVKAALADHHFDAVVNWIAFVPEDIERDLEYFRGKCDQYIFISSASVYQKPMAHPIVTESTPLANPFWQYSRNKIACEERLMKAYREETFPMTIVRPSHTYDTILPLAVGPGRNFTVLQRMLDGKPIVVHGDGTTLWVLTHSEDFAKGFVGLLANPQTIGHAIHITSDYLLTWNQITEQVGAALGVKPNIVHMPSAFINKIDPRTGEGLLGDKMFSVIFDNSKVKMFVPDYVATIPFSEGIKQTIAKFKAHPQWSKSSAEDDAKMEELLAAYKSQV